MHAYHRIHLGNTSINVKKSFDELLLEPWLKDEDGMFIFRSYLQAKTGCEKYFSLCEHDVFFPSKKLNFYSSGVFDKYQKIRKDVAEEIMNLVFSKLLPLLPKTNYDVGIHQIRIETNDQQSGEPTPESVHQAGFKYIAIYCSKIENIAGGDTTLIPHHDGGNDGATFKIQAGEAIIFNDANYLHYTTPVVSLLPGKGVRDVFVITFDIDGEK